MSEGLRRSSSELRRNDLNQSRAGGTRTHDFRLIMLYSNSAVDRCLLLFLSQRKARESNPHLYSRTALAVQPSKPYLATFQKVQVESPRFELGFSPCHGDVFPLDHDPICDSTQRFVRESNSIFVLTKNACSRNTYKPLPPVIAEGIEPSISCVSCRCLSRWTTRASNKVVETGVEPAESLGSRPSRFSGLRTQPIWKMAGPGFAPGSPSL